MTYHIPLLIVAIFLFWPAFVMIWGHTKTFDFDKIKQKRLTKKTGATKRSAKQKKMRVKVYFRNKEGGRE